MKQNWLIYTSKTGGYISHFNPDNIYSLYKYVEENDYIIVDILYNLSKEEATKILNQRLKTMSQLSSLCGKNPYKNFYGKGSKI